MNPFPAMFWLVAAILLFWAVGAYNRLVRLRNVILRRFVPVDQQLAQRSTLLQRQIDLLAVQPGPAQRELEELRAARAQADAAWEAARRRPGAVGAINSLRMALQILAQVRTRLSAAVSAAPELEALHLELAACDNALSFAQGQFNDAVQQYNAAVRQFPTGLLAILFQFRGATPL
jgi:LemA protein